MEKQAGRNFMNLIKSEHKAWTLGWTKPCNRTGWGQLIKSSSVKKSQGLGGTLVWPWGSSTLGQQRNHHKLGCTNKGAASRSGEELCSTIQELWDALECCPQPEVPTYRRHWSTRASPREATRWLEAEAWGIWWEPVEDVSLQSGKGQLWSLLVPLVLSVSWDT